ncbi:MAG: arylsulfotransferase family protein [Pseudomonadota bacterium]
MGIKDSLERALERYVEFLDRQVPMWAVLTGLLLAIPAVVVFGAAVRDKAIGAGRLGPISDAAFQIASFPAMVEDVFTEVSVPLSQDLTIDVPPVDLTGYTAPSNASDFELAGLYLRAAPGAPQAWRLVIGKFSIGGKRLNAALLLDPDNAIQNLWFLGPGGATRNEALDRPVFPHGAVLLSDGSLVYTSDGGSSIEKQSACGTVLWSLDGSYNHSVSMGVGGHTVWSLRADSLTLDHFVEIDVATGDIVRSISTDDIIAANPEIDILEIRQVHANEVSSNPGSIPGDWLHDPFHHNDLEPLPASLVGAFPAFAIGDLLVSARTNNLVYVVDPQTAKIKWWSVGRSIRQHDPDWAADGKIYVYNNRMNRDLSQIISIDPVTYETDIVYEDPAFYSRIRGKHETLPSGFSRITSPQQGRAFEIGAGGETVFQLYNRDSVSPTRGLVVSELAGFPEGYFEEGAFRCESGR